MKLKVYIETSIPSYLTARISNDLRVMAHQSITLEWWESRRFQYDLFISEFVVAESSLGDPAAATRRLSILENITALEITESVRQLGQRLVKEGAIPKDSAIDAYHIAVDAVNGMDYLLTWNCKHIANALLRPKIEEICRGCGYEPPLICTPLELLEE